MLLDEMAAGLNRRVVDLPTTTAAERDRLLFRWIDTGPEAPAGTVPARFAQQVRRTPDAPAVVWTEGELSCVLPQASAARGAKLASPRSVRRGSGDMIARLTDG